MGSKKTFLKKIRAALFPLAARGPQRLSQEGVTIVEAMMVVGAIAFVMAMITTLSYTGMTTWQKQTARVQMESDAQNVMYVLSFNLRQAQPGTVAISNMAGEQPESLISFTPIGGSNPVSMYLQSVKTPAGTVTTHRVIFCEPKGATPTYNTKVLAENVLSLYFTFPKISDTSRVMANITLQKQPLKNKSPVVYQAQEIIYVRQ